MIIGPKVAKRCSFEKFLRDRERQAGRQAGRQADRQTARQTDRQTDRERERERAIKKESDFLFDSFYLIL